MRFADTPQQRVKFLLGKLDNDRRHGTDYFAHKFMGKVETIFAALPKRKEWRSFYNNDLPLLNIPEVVLDVAAKYQLNESQRAMIAARLANIAHGEFVGNQHVGEANLPTPKVSNAEAAEKLKVSERSVKTAKKVQHEAHQAIAH